jgi:cytochrome d oxidase, subunit II (cydB)
MILHDLISYEVLRVIWWLLLGIVLIGFAIMDGFDLGTATLLPFVSKNDMERRIVINTIGPVWEGNQVWLILGGGAIFAAWPTLYAVSFSGFYLAMFAILFALILRPVGFKYRSKIESPLWRMLWDWALFIGGAVPALIFGVAVGNVLQGVPFRLTDEMQIIYEGSFFGLLNPYALLCGLLSVAMLVMQGAVWLVLKTSGLIAERARTYGIYAGYVTCGLFVLNGLIIWLMGSGYSITSPVITDGPSDPLLKTVSQDSITWFSNYAAYPWMLLAPLLGIAGSVSTVFLLQKNREGIGFVTSSLSLLGIIATVGLSMFPMILPSSLQPEASLTVWDSSSSHMTLFIMLIVTVIFVPIVLAYTAWVFKVLWGKVDETDIRDDVTHAY